jgi:hypothetical protein
MICFAEAKYYEARALEIESYQMRKTVFGLKHPETLISAHNIGLIAEKLGRIDVAVKALTEAFIGRLEVMGQSHIETRESLRSLKGVCLSHLEHGSEGALPLLCTSILNALGKDTSDTQHVILSSTVWMNILAEADQLCAGGPEWEKYTAHEVTSRFPVGSFSEDLDKLWTLLDYM